MQRAEAEALETNDMNNPKLDPNPPDNTQKDPANWVSGDDPMTGAQTSYLRTLSEQAKTPEMFADDLTKAEASRRIDALKAKSAQ